MVHVACSPSLQSHRFSRAFGWSTGPRCRAPKKTLQKYFPASSAEAASSGTSLDWPGGSSCCGRSFSLYSVSWRQGPSPAVSCGQSLTSFLPASRMLPQPPPPRRASGAESCPLRKGQAANPAPLRPPAASSSLRGSRPRLVSRACRRARPSPGPSKEL